MDIIQKKNISILYKKIPFFELTFYVIQKYPHK